MIVKMYVEHAKLFFPKTEKQQTAFDLKRRHHFNHQTDLSTSLTLDFDNLTY